MLAPLALAAQPNGYYNSAAGLNGTALRQALHDIIDNHNDIGYSALWSAYEQTDAKPNGKVWDMYSDKPGQTPPYEFSFVTDQCGSYNSENDCFNREHTFPDGYFNGASPMHSDLFMVFPSDGFVNGKRSNFPYGKVNNPTWTSLNGSKLGPNAFPGAPSGTAFEPIDSFKGDLARTYFYVATRYFNEDGGWDDWEMANGAELKSWAVQMLLQWHHNDPVSAKEVNRNNAVYSFQNNRNPFIDNPMYADCIWGTADCSQTTSVSGPDAVQLYIVPNPASDYVELQSGQVGGAISVMVISTDGKAVYQGNLNDRAGLRIPVDNWAKGVYMIHFRSAGNAGVRKLVIQ